MATFTEGLFRVVNYAVVGANFRGFCRQLVDTWMFQEETLFPASFCKIARFSWFDCLLSPSLSLSLTMEEDSLINLTYINITYIKAVKYSKDDAFPVGFHETARKWGYANEVIRSRKTHSEIVWWKIGAGWCSTYDKWPLNVGTSCTNAGLIDLSFA